MGLSSTWALARDSGALKKGDIGAPLPAGFLRVRGSQIVGLGGAGLDNRIGTNGCVRNARNFAMPCEITNTWAGASPGSVEFAC